jgi:hypothetical protein
LDAKVTKQSESLQLRLWRISSGDGTLFVHVASKTKSYEEAYFLFNGRVPVPGIFPDDHPGRRAG